MLKKELLARCKEPTRQTFKNEPLYIGDLYSWTDEKIGLILPNPSHPTIENGLVGLLVRTSENEFIMLPQEKAKLNEATFLGNISEDEALMSRCIELGFVIEDEHKTKSKAKTKAKKEEPQMTQKDKTIQQLINEIRLAWKDKHIEKEGRGKAGGGAKYDYYKPQQIIDFTTEEEIKRGLYSDFNIVNGVAIYSAALANDPQQFVTIQCPADIPRKMAASEAQQIGAALTYYNRRLAMILYKIEDNSPENEEIMDNADYSEKKEAEIPIPNIPAPDVPTVKAPSAPSPAPLPPVTSVVAPQQAPPLPPRQSVASAAAPLPPQNPSPSTSTINAGEEQAAKNGLLSIYD